MPVLASAGRVDGTGSAPLILCGHRYYDPENGRWLTRHPIGYAGGTNLYSYCGGDPVNFADPSGLDSQETEEEKYLDQKTTEYHARAKTTVKVGFKGVNLGFKCYIFAAENLMWGSAETVGSYAVRGVVGAGGKIGEGASAAGRWVAESRLGRWVGETGSGIGRSISRLFGRRAEEETTAVLLARSRHLKEKQVLRGITDSQIDLVLRKEKRYWDPKTGTVNYVLEKAYGRGHDVLVGTDPASGYVTTAIEGRKPVRKRMVPLP